jgi:hypothetical protein
MTHQGAGRFLTIRSLMSAISMNAPVSGAILLMAMPRIRMYCMAADEGLAGITRTQARRFLPASLKVPSIARYAASTRKSGIEAFYRID